MHQFPGKPERNVRTPCVATQDPFDAVRHLKREPSRMPHTCSSLPAAHLLPHGLTSLAQTVDRTPQRQHLMADHNGGSDTSGPEPVSFPLREVVESAIHRQV